MSGYENTLLWESRLKKAELVPWFEPENLLIQGV